MDGDDIVARLEMIAIKTEWIRTERPQRILIGMVQRRRRQRSAYFQLDNDRRECVELR